MRHFYQASPQKIAAVLSDLADDDFSVGLVFEQQIKLPNSVPDALISQPPMDVFFETKRGGDLDQKQIERHILSISQSVTHTSRKILFGLTKMPIDHDIQEQLESKAKSHKIIFIAITFADNGWITMDRRKNIQLRKPQNGLKVRNLFNRIKYGCIPLYSSYTPSLSGRVEVCARREALLP